MIDECNGSPELDGMDISAGTVDSLADAGCRTAQIIIKRSRNYLDMTAHLLLVLLQALKRSFARCANSLV